MADTTMQDWMNNLPPNEDRIALVIEHPNGISICLFDSRGGYLTSEPAYLDLFRALKNDVLDYEMNDAANAAKSSLMESGYLLSDFIYPGCYDIEEFVSYKDGDEMYTSFQGVDFTVDSIIATTMPIM